MAFIEWTRETSQFCRPLSHCATLPLHPSNAAATLNIERMELTLEVTHFERSPLNAVAKKNISFIFVTWVTSQLEISWLNECATAHSPVCNSGQVEDSIWSPFWPELQTFPNDTNMSVMSVTLEVSHSPMIPFEFVPANVGQVPPGVSNKHLSIAILSSAPSFGVKLAAVWSGNQHHSKKQSRQTLQEEGWWSMVVVVVFQ